MQVINSHSKQFKLHFGNDELDLDTIYLEHYSPLRQYAYTLINDSILAEEMVHQVFLKILEKTEPVNVRTSLKAYLYRSVYNECLNFIKHEKVKQTHQAYSTNVMNQQTDNPSGRLQYKELENQLKKALNDLPEQCRTIFQLSRFEELKYAEIAAQLGLSVKTVEGQMSKALKRLRLQLADYLPLILWLLVNWML